LPSKRITILNQKTIKYPYHADRLNGSCVIPKRIDEDNAVSGLTGSTNAKDPRDTVIAANDKEQQAINQRRLVDLQSVYTSNTPASIWRKHTANSAESDGVHI
jgi:hypothetical protein